MANTIITPSIIAKEALAHLKNNLVMGARVHREFRNEFTKVGDTVSIRKPVQFVASDGAARVNQDVTESSVPFVINKHKHVSWTFSNKDLTLSIEEFSKRYIQPASIALANIVDSDLATLYQDLFATTGTAGATPNTIRKFLEPAAELNRNAVPQERRSLVVDPDAQLEAAVALSTLNAPQSVEGAVRGMRIGMMGDMELFMDQNIKSHTAGTANGAYLSNGVAQVGASIGINTGVGTFVVGDKVTFANVNAVNPVSKADIGKLKVFTVTSASAGGAVNLAISPSIVATGAFQNVTQAIPDNSALVLTASYQANLAFHRNTFGLVMVPLEMPDGISFKARATDENISILIMKDFDINTYDEVIRMDILYGVKTIYPELGSVLLG